MSDLDQAARRARLDGHEVDHFTKSPGVSRNSRQDGPAGKFDSGKLDKAIHNLEHLA